MRKKKLRELQRAADERNCRLWYDVIVRSWQLEDRASHFGQYLSGDVVEFMSADDVRKQCAILHRLVNRFMSTCATPARYAIADLARWGNAREIDWSGTPLANAFPMHHSIDGDSK